MTNADKFFRNTTDEELARTIDELDWSKWCLGDTPCDIPGEDACQKCLIKWLRQEAAE